MLCEATPTFLSQLSERDQSRVLSLGATALYPSGALLLRQNEPSARVVLLLDGRVKIECADTLGRELLLGIGDPGDIFGELALLSGEPRVASVIAVESVQARLIPAAQMLALLEHNPAISAALMATAARRVRTTTVTWADFARTDTMGRLAARLVALADRYGHASNAGVVVESPLSREELVAWTGASRAGVCSALGMMRKLGWVHVEGNTLLLSDVETLRDRARASA